MLLSTVGEIAGVIVDVNVVVVCKYVTMDGVAHMIMFTQVMVPTCATTC